MSRSRSAYRELNAALDASRHPIALFNAQRELIFLNPAAAEWLGVDADTLPAGPLPFVHDLDVEHSARAWLGIAPPPDACAGQPATRLLRSTSSTVTYTGHYVPLGQGDSCEVLLTSHPTIAGETVPLLPAHSAKNSSTIASAAAYWIGESRAMQRFRERMELAVRGPLRLWLTAPTVRQAAAVVERIRTTMEPSPQLLKLHCAAHDAISLQTFIRQAARRLSGNSPVLVWLNNPGRLAPGAQQELLGFLRQPGFSWGMIATSRRALSRVVGRGGFDRELAERLSTLRLTLPRLGRRPEDLPQLAQWAVDQFNLTHEKQLQGVHDEALARLAAYRWPGDVDEFLDLFTQAAENAVGQWITPAALPERLKSQWDDWQHPPTKPQNIPLDETLAVVEKELLQRALALAKGNKSQASLLLGISRPRLIRRLEQLGLAKPSEREIDFQPLDDADHPHSSTPREES